MYMPVCVTFARCINAIGEYKIVIYREKYLEKETMKEMKKKKNMPRKKTESIIIIDIK